jgi:transcriptional regulator GlxA family with amidase domain
MDDRVAQTIARMEEQLNSPLRLPRLAAAVHLSVSQLTRLFRRDLGISPGAYLVRLRMIRARYLVEQTRLTVAEIRAQVGISDPSHFARDFRRAHGLSPMFLRRHLRVHSAAANPDIAQQERIEDRTATGSRSDETSGHAVESRVSEGTAVKGRPSSGR